MDVLVVAEQLRRPVPGGIGVYLRAVVNALPAAAGPDGARVTLWTSRRPRRDPDPVADLRLPVVTHPLPGRALTFASDRGLVVTPSGYDVVHATSLGTARSRDAPQVTMVHDLAWREVPEAFPARGRRWHEAALRRAMARSRLLLSPSRATADALVRTGADAASVEVVPHGGDHLPPADDDAASELLERSGVGGEFLLSVSTLEPRKNLSRLIGAFRHVRARLAEPWPLVVVGPDGWGERHRPEPGVILTGRVEDALLAALYARARLVAYVPLYEGFGLPAVEAMNAGKPVVASAMPSTGTAALTVDPYDVEAIAAALARAAMDERLRAELVEAGRAQAASLTWERSARGHVDAWAATRRAGPRR